LLETILVCGNDTVMPVLLTLEVSLKLGIEFLNSTSHFDGTLDRTVQRLIEKSEPDDLLTTFNLGFLFGLPSPLVLAVDLVDSLASHGTVNELRVFPISLGLVVLVHEVIERSPRKLSRIEAQNLCASKTRDRRRREVQPFRLSPSKPGHG